ncbi:MFS transporter [Rhodoferax lacus]|uniref:MFS transporter n=1 Tax=Rhodoferax lacus TaxID=2184758 RepID=A0A3E1R9N0_9BURK|nr:MFS transporter [Rhodoferax lacus]RFO95732.1 MFS transporter [Rhodoferax lacus]
MSPSPPSTSATPASLWARLRLLVLGDGVQASRPVVWVIGFFAFLNVYSMQAVLPLLMRDFAATPLQAGATVGATVLAIALVSPFIGMLSDALGRKRILCSALFALCLPTGLIALAGDLHTIVLLRFLQGLVVPGIVVVMIAYLSEEFRSGGVARMTSTYVGGTVMGGFCGRFITGHLSDVMGWRSAYVALAVLNLLGAIWVLRALPASRHFVANRNFPVALQTLARHLRNRRFVAICGLGFCVLFSLVGSFTYVNLYLAEAPFHLSSAGLANVFAVYLLGVVVTPQAGRFIVRHGFLRTVLSMLALSACALLLTLLPVLLAVIAGLALSSCGVFICQSATISHIADTVTEGRSLATGIYYLSYYAGGAAGAWIAGLAFEGWGWSGSVLSIILFQGLAAAIALCFLRPRAGAVQAGS